MLLSEISERRSYFTIDSQSVCLGIEHPCGTCDQILLPVGMLLSEICGLVSVGRPLWREDGSVEVEITLRLTIGQYVSVSCTLVGLATIYYFLSECCCLKFAVLYLWGALSDERSCLQFAVSGCYFTTDGQSVCIGIEHPCGTCDQILLPIGMLLSEICGLVSVGHPLWREDGSAICSVITEWSELLRTHNQTSLSHLRLPQPGGEVRLVYDWRSVSMSWYRAPLWDLWPDITSCRNVAALKLKFLVSGSCLERMTRFFFPVWQLWVSWSSAPSLARGWVCNSLLQLLLGLARAVTLGSNSRWTPDHILLSHFRLPQPGGPGSRIYIPREQGVPVIPPGTGFPFRRLLRVAGLQWRNSNPPPHGFVWNLRGARIYIRIQSVPHRKHITSPLQSPLMLFKEKNAVYCNVRWGYFTTDSQSICLGDQILLPVEVLRSEMCEGRRSKLLYDTVSQYVLVSSTLVGPTTRYYFLLGC
jgi:hypothetical protein